MYVMTVGDLICADCTVCGMYRIFDRNGKLLFIQEGNSGTDVEVMFGDCEATLENYDREAIYSFEYSSSIKGGIICDIKIERESYR